MNSLLAISLLVCIGLFQSYSVEAQDDVAAESIADALTELEEAQEDLEDAYGDDYGGARSGKYGRHGKNSKLTKNAKKASKHAKQAAKYANMVAKKI